MIFVEVECIGYRIKSEELFIFLCHLPREAAWSARAVQSAQGVERRQQAMRGLVQNDGGVGIGQLFNGLPSSLARAGEKADKGEAERGQCTGDQGGDGGAWPRKRDDFVASGDGGCDNLGTRIGNARGARLGDEGNGAAELEMGEQRRNTAAPVVLVTGDEDG